MSYSYNKDEIKNNLTTEQVEAYVADLGGEPQHSNNCLICKTICHNTVDGSHKLFYYPNTHLFKCYTECGDTFDIFELTERVKKQQNPNFTFFNAIQYVANYFGIGESSIFEEDAFQLTDWEIFDKMKIEELDMGYQKGELPQYNDKILSHLPAPIVEGWLQEGISKEVMREANIRYDPISDSIIIPHYNIDGKLIGIRRRALVEEDAEKYGKYIPATLNGKMYNHPLSFNLYNLNLSKENIKETGMAIVYESEKSCLQTRTFFGADGDISVACCGSNLVLHQAELLRKIGAKELVIAFDKQFKEIGDDEYRRWTKKLREIHKKYYKDFLISFMFDKENKYLGYKSSPSDMGKDVFLKLFKERIYL